MAGETSFVAWCLVNASVTAEVGRVATACTAAGLTAGSTDDVLKLTTASPADVETARQRYAVGAMSAAVLSEDSFPWRGNGPPYGR